MRGRLARDGGRAAADVGSGLGRAGAQTRRPSSDDELPNNGHDDTPSPRYPSSSPFLKALDGPVWPKRIPRTCIPCAIGRKSGPRRSAAARSGRLASPRRPDRHDPSGLRTPFAPPGRVFSLLRLIHARNSGWSATWTGPSLPLSPCFVSRARAPPPELTSPRPSFLGALDDRLPAQTNRAAPAVRADLGGRGQGRLFQGARDPARGGQHPVRRQPGHRESRSAPRFLRLAGLLPALARAPSGLFGWFTSTLGGAASSRWWRSELVGVLDGWGVQLQLVGRAASPSPARQFEADELVRTAWADMPSPGSPLVSCRSAATSTASSST